MYETVYSANIFSRNRFTENWTSTLRIGQSSDDGRSFDNSTRYSSLHSTQTQYQWQNDLRLPLGSALLGIERVEQQVSSPDTAFTVTSRSINSFLAGWTGNLGNHRLQVNARQDNNSQFGDKTTGMIAYGYQFTENWRGNVSAGSAFKAPTFNDMYWPGAGNPNLKPETSENREAALHYETATQHASVTYYHNRVDNLIQWAPVDAYNWLPSNVARATLSGWTFAYNGHLDAYTLSGSLYLQDPKDDILETTLQYRARKHGKIALSREFGRFDLGGEVIASGMRYNDAANTQVLGGYGTANLFANYRVGGDWSVFARANNILDKKYMLIQDYATPGANLFVGVRYAPK